MANDLSKQPLFRTPPVRNKSAATSGAAKDVNTAWGIIAAEADQRKAKTLAQRQARLQFEAGQEKPAPVVKRSRKAPVSRP